jgi:hypothetical protein
MLGVWCHTRVGGDKLGYGNVGALTVTMRIGSGSIDWNYGDVDLGAPKCHISNICF